MVQLETVQVTHNKKSIQHNARNYHNQRKITVNNGQKDSVNNMPLHRTTREPNEKKMMLSPQLVIEE